MLLAEGGGKVCERKCVVGFSPSFVVLVGTKQYGRSILLKYDLSETCVAVRESAFSMEGTVTNLLEVCLCFRRMH